MDFRFFERSFFFGLNKLLNLAGFLGVGFFFLLLFVCFVATVLIFCSDVIFFFWLWIKVWNLSFLGTVHDRIPRSMLYIVSLWDEAVNKQKTSKKMSLCFNKSLHISAVG